MTDSLPEKTATAHQATGLGVAASPFNSIKLELGICLILGAVLWLGADSITANEGAQLLMLMVYSLLAAIWLVLRTRLVLRRLEAERPPNETQ